MNINSGTVREIDLEAGDMLMPDEVPISIRAKKDCKQCWGKGLLSLTGGSGSGKKTICSCAKARIETSDERAWEIIMRRRLGPAPEPAFMKPFAEQLMALEQRKKLVKGE